MILLFDLGNSRAKWATWDTGRFAQDGSVDVGAVDRDQRLLLQLQGMPRPDRILLASVADPQVAAAVQRATQSLWGQQVIVLQSRSRQCGVSSAYADPSQMGVDRWLAMLAAWNRFRCAVCVMDIGTAVTADVVAPDGQHLGGIIAPGILLSQSALQSHTAGIRHPPVGARAALGHSTGECVANGCLLGVVGTARMALELMQQSCGNGGQLVVTGGDAPHLLPFLPAPCVHVPTLVFDGMLLAAGER